MIRNNFRILLAEQKKKMSDVEKDTGLSKTTIRNLYYENAKGIQFSTLETVCSYLNCDVGELIEFKGFNECEVRELNKGRYGNESVTII